MKNNPISKIAMILFIIAVYMMITIVPQGNNLTPIRVSNDLPLSKSPINISLAVSTAPSSVLMNNYDNWTGPRTWLSDYQQKVAIVARMDRVCMSERYSDLGALTPQMLKSMNPDMKVFRMYDLSCKSGWDYDWSDPSRNNGMGTPLPKSLIDAHDWWLRDGNGDIVKESDMVWMLDVGKPGFKEAFLEATLNKMDGQGYDGIVFDYLWPDMITFWVTSKGHPAPLDYPNDSVWYSKAWQPFVQYVMAGVHDAGYTIIGNCAGEFRTSDPRRQWQRTQVDGQIYEQWCVGWTGAWLPGATIETRIAAYRDDPLEAWNTDLGIQGTDPNYRQKMQMALAMHYIAKSSSTGTRFHYSCKDMDVFWEPLWDLNIGVPSTSAVQPYYSDSPTSSTTRRYFWYRTYTNGLVLMNYNTASGGITYRLSQKYRDVSGNIYSGRITIPPHSALILQKQVLVSHVVQGTIDLQNYTGSKLGVAGTVSLKEGSTTLETHNISLDSSGKYSFTTSLGASYTSVAKCSHWLAKATPVTINVSGATTSDFSLVNGDIDNDNYIGNSDYDIWVACYDSSIGETRYKPMADLDGDGYIGNSDYDILQANYDLTGD